MNDERKETMNNEQLKKPFAPLRLCVKKKGTMNDERKETMNNEQLKPFT